MDGGLVHEIVNLPPNINVTVLDYDTEGVEKSGWNQSGRWGVVRHQQVVNAYARLHHRSNGQGAEADLEESG